MRVKDQFDSRLDYFFVNAIPTLNSVNRLRLNRHNGHDPTLKANALLIPECDVSVVPELDSENLLACQKGILQIVRLVDFLRHRD